LSLQNHFWPFSEQACALTGKKYDEKELEHIKSDEKEQEDLVEKISSEVSLDANKRKEIMQDLDPLTPSINRNCRVQRQDVQKR
jgi:hypothetical protein